MADFNPGLRNLMGAGALLLLTACGAGSTAADGDGSPFAFGHPSDVSSATRTIEIVASDQLAFNPATVTVRRGETVSFVVTNDGATDHEFVLGDQTTQAEHAAEMRGMGDMHMGDEPNAVRIAPGATKSVTWTFLEHASEIEFACHLPGHYEGGMRGTLQIS